ncbi:hypothetical protein SprV_0401408500 [Sparganum proliferum]
MQRSICLFAAACDNFGLVINTEEMLFPTDIEAEVAGPNPGYELNGTDGNLQHLQLRWRDHLVRMDDERLPKRLFCGDVVVSSRRQGDQVRRYKDTLKTSLKRLYINPANWEDLAETTRLGAGQ